MKYSPTTGMMVDGPPFTHAGLSMRLRHLLINVLVFASTYPLANHIAQNADVQRSFALPIDSLIPLVPWMIVPYLTSGIFFVACFFFVRSEDDVRVLSQRILLATVVAALVFATMPARFSLPRPVIDHPLFGALFDLLAVVDRPYNQLSSLKQWLACYFAASFALVSVAFARGDRFFLKKSQGRFPLHVWLLYGPYLLGYRLTWLIVRLRERACAPFTQAGAGLWVGRSLSTGEAEKLPAHCAIIDLAKELSESPMLRSRRYLHFPLLDLHAPPATAVADILDAMSTEAQAGRPIYLHCAMGYRRSRTIARRFLDGLPS